MQGERASLQFLLDTGAQVTLLACGCLRLVDLSKMTGDGSRNVTTIPSLIITAQGGGGQDPVPRETPDMAASFIIAGTIATGFRIAHCPC